MRGRWPSLAERAFQKVMKHHSIPRVDAISVRVQFADLVSAVLREHETRGAS